MVRNGGLRPVVFLAVLAAVLWSSAARAAGDVVVVRWDGPIGPVTSGYLTEAIELAESADAALLVIGMDTPGGLDTAMRDIIRAISASEIPIALWVGPSGSRAASAGCVIGIASHILAMAPGTNIGAAHPVPVGGGGMDSTMTAKVTQDAEAYIQSLAEARGRNVEWARDAVVKSVSVAAEEAVSKNVADFIAADIEALIDQADGRTVTTARGEIVLALSGAAVVYVEPDWRTRRALTLLNDPNVAYILLLLGIYGLFFELSNPGALFPGIFGAISLILGLYSLANLSINYAGLLLILAGVIMLVLEIKITSGGLLSVGGVAALLIGSLFLIDSPFPFFRVSLGVIVPAVIITAVFFLFLVGKGLRAQKRPAAIGPQALVGVEAEARTPLKPRGTVFVNGSHWAAESAEPVEAGAVVVVVSVNDLRLVVRPRT